MVANIDIRKAVWLVNQAVSIFKAPPGPKPQHFGDDVDWNESKRKWMCPVEGCEEKHKHEVDLSSLMVEGRSSSAANIERVLLLAKKNGDPDKIASLKETWVNSVQSITAENFDKFAEKVYTDAFSRDMLMALLQQDNSAYSNSVNDTAAFGIGLDTANELVHVVDEQYAQFIEEFKIARPSDFFRPDFLEKAGKATGDVDMYVDTYIRSLENDLGNEEVVTNYKKALVQNGYSTQEQADKMELFAAWRKGKGQEISAAKSALEGKLIQAIEAGDFSIALDAVNDAYKEDILDNTTMYEVKNWGNKQLEAYKERAVEHIEEQVFNGTADISNQEAFIDAVLEEHPYLETSSVLTAMNAGLARKAREEKLSADRPFTRADRGLSSRGYRTDLITSELNNFIPYDAPSYVAAAQHNEISGYTGVDYQPINGCLRADYRCTEESLRKIKVIKDLMSPMIEPQTLYRGLEEAPDDLIRKLSVEGDITTLDGFNSTSRNPETAMGFAKLNVEIDPYTVEPEDMGMEEFDAWIEGRYYDFEEYYEGPDEDYDVPEDWDEWSENDKDEFRIEHRDEAYVDWSESQREIYDEEFQEAVENYIDEQSYKPDAIFMEILPTSETLAITLANADTAHTEDETILDSGIRVRVDSIEENKEIQSVDGAKVVGIYVVLSVISEEEYQESLDISKAFVKGPPGPRPAHFGPHVDWDDSRRRWLDTRNPDESILRPKAEGTDLYSVSQSGYSNEEELGKAWGAVDAYAERFNTEGRVIDAPSYTSAGSESWMYYTDYGYVEINEALRSGDESSLDDITREVIDDLFSDIVPLEETQILYRGMPEPLLNATGGFAEPGDIISMDGFTSASRKPSTAVSFAELKKAAHSTVMEIHTLSDTEGATLFTGEHETVLGPGQKFHVLNVEADHSVWTSYGSKETVTEYIVGVIAPAHMDTEQVRTLLSKAVIETKLSKAAPRPKPAHFGDYVDWNEEKRRWMCPVEGCEEKHKHETDKAFYSALNPRDLLSNRGDWPMVRNIIGDSIYGQFTVEETVTYLKDNFGITEDTADVLIEYMKYNDRVKKAHIMQIELLKNEVWTALVEEQQPDDIKDAIRNKDKFSLVTPEDIDSVLWEQKRRLQSERVKLIEDIVRDIDDNWEDYVDSIDHMIDWWSDNYSYMERWKIEDTISNEVDSRKEAKEEIKEILSEPPVYAFLGASVNDFDISEDYNDTIVPEESPSYKNVLNHTKLKDYTGSGYEAINRVLRNSIRKGTPLTSYAQESVSAIQKLMTPMIEPQTLYRGIDRSEISDMSKYFNEGEIVAIDGFASTSRAADNAITFSNAPSVVGVPGPSMSFEDWLDGMGLSYTFDDWIGDNAPEEYWDWGLEERMRWANAASTEAWDALDEWTEQYREDYEKWATEDKERIANEREDNALVMEIRTSSHTPAITLSDKDTGHSENETILNHGQRIRIDKVYRNTVVKGRFSNSRVGYYVVATVVGEDEDDAQIEVAKTLVKAPPGPKPEHFGDNVDWNEEKHKWTCPMEGCDVEHSHRYYDPPSETDNGLRSLAWGYAWGEIYDGIEKFDDMNAPTIITSMSNGLKHYVSSGYRNINSYQRGEINATLSYEDQEAIKDIDSAMKPIEEPQITYRGMSNDLRNKDGEFPQIGEVLDIDAYMSTSRSPGIASDFTGSVFMEVHSTPDAEAITFPKDPDNLDPSDYDDVYDEMETLYGRGQKFRIDNIEFGKRISRGGYTFTFGVYVTGTIMSAEESKSIQKGPPGPRPAHFGDYVVWDDNAAGGKGDWVDSRKQYQAGGGSEKESKSAYRRRMSEDFSASTVIEALKDFDVEGEATYQNPSLNPGVESYLGDAHETMNELLTWGFVEPLDEDYLEELQNMVEDMAMDMSPIGHDDYPVLYRGLDIGFRHQGPGMNYGVIEGDTFEISSFMSTSRNPTTALNFASSSVDAEPVLVEIMPNASTRAMSISNNDTGFDEDETIIDFGQQLKVEKIIQNVTIPFVTALGSLSHRTVKYIVASMVSNEDVSLSKSMMKVAPGPPPRPGLKWKEETHRWIRPKEDTKESQASVLNDDDYPDIQGEIDFVGEMKLKPSKNLNKLAKRIGGLFQGAIKDYIDMANYKLLDYDKASFDGQKEKLLAVDNLLRRSEAEINKVLPSVPKDNDIYKDVLKSKYAIGYQRRKVRAVLHEKRLYEFGVDIEFKLMENFDAVRRLVDKSDKLQVQDAEEDRYALLNSLDEGKRYLKAAYIDYAKGNEESAESALLGAKWSILNAHDTVVAYEKHSFLTDDMINISYRHQEDIEKRITAWQLDEIQYPTKEVGKAVSTGKALKEANNLQEVHAWEIPGIKAALGYATEDPSSDNSDFAKIGKMQVRASTRAIVRQLKPKLQKKFQDIMDKADVYLFNPANHDWEGAVLSAFPDLPPEFRANVAGFCGSQGIQIPGNAARSTIVHEIGHHIDLWNVLSDATHDRMRILFNKRRSREGQRFSTVRAYATENQKEYFADTFAHFIEDPVHLYNKDPEAYKILSEGLFQ